VLLSPDLNEHAKGDMLTRAAAATLSQD
jgi:hypothetical protein